MKNPKAIWILEDHKGSQFVYEQVLGPRYALRIFSRVSEFRGALAAAAPHFFPDLVIADLKLPDESFLDFLLTEDIDRLLAMPFLIVSSNHEEEVLRVCFAEGAQDYLTKPFSETELLVKVERIFETVAHSALKPISGAPTLEVDAAKLIAKIGSDFIALTAKEMQILKQLSEAEGRAVSRGEILLAIWGNVRVGRKTLDAHVLNLRRKLAPYGWNIEYVMRSQGFSLSCNGMDGPERGIGKMGVAVKSVAEDQGHRGL